MWRWHELYGCGRDAAVGGAAGRELRSREFLLAAGVAAGSGGDYSATTIGNSTLGMLTNDFTGACADHAREGGDAGTRGGREQRDDADRHAGVDGDAGYDQFLRGGGFDLEFRGSGATSPVQIDVPNQPGDGGNFGAIGERARSGERRTELNPLTRWQIGERRAAEWIRMCRRCRCSGLNLAGQGTIDLVGIGFTI